jgi:DNA-binding GntR family transcriptional regulator
MTDLPGFSTRADAVADQLRRAILAGEFEAGTRLRQADLAERFGVSTTPVREAFVSLMREGFLTGDPHKGMMVREPNVDELNELYEMRIALEPLAAGKAAERISDEDLADLDALVSEMRALAATATAEAEARHNELNTVFHRRIYESADRPRLSELIMSLRTQSDIYIPMFPLKFVERGTSDEQHAAIVDALRTRSPKRAERAMRDHLKFNAAHIAAQLNEAGPPSGRAERAG